MCLAWRASGTVAPSQAVSQRCLALRSRGPMPWDVHEGQWFGGNKRKPSVLVTDDTDPYPNPTPIPSYTDTSALRACWPLERQVSIGDYDNKRYCGSVALQSATPARTQGAYSQFHPALAVQLPLRRQLGQSGAQHFLSVADSANLLESWSLRHEPCFPVYQVC